MRIFGLLLPRVLLTILTIGFLSYLGWRFSGYYGSHPAFDMCILGTIGFFISLYLFWGALPRNRSINILRMVTKEHNKEEVTHKLNSLLGHNGFVVRKPQTSDKLLEAAGQWWVFSEKIQAKFKQQQDNELLVTIEYDIKRLSSFHTEPMFPFIPSIFVTVRTIVLRSKIQNALQVGSFVKVI